MVETARPDEASILEAEGWTRDARFNTYSIIIDGVPLKLTPIIVAGAWEWSLSTHIYGETLSVPSRALPHEALQDIAFSELLSSEQHQAIMQHAYLIGIRAVAKSLGVDASMACVHSIAYKVARIHLEAQDIANQATLQPTCEPPDPPTEEET